MQNVISLDDFRNKKQQQKQQQEVKKPENLSFEERQERIKQSIARINSLIAQLEANKT